MYATSDLDLVSILRRKTLSKLVFEVLDGESIGSV
jgi:hypothetical protein